MTAHDPVNGSPTRLRRPQPTRTGPRRNILGVFSQKDGPGPAGNAQPGKGPAAPTFSGPPAGAHPLGFSMEQDAAPHDRAAAPGFDPEALQAADSVVDKHIRDGSEHRIPIDTTSWKRLSSLAGSIDPGEIADLARALTQGYVTVAQSWVEMADKLRDVLGAQAQTQGQARAGAGSSEAAAPPPAPAICIQSTRRLSARAQMFATGAVATVNPLAPELAPEKAGLGEMITDVSFSDGQIDIHVPETMAPGRYHGVILSSETGPVGIVTVTIPDPADAAP